jgi:flagellar capping protein FliD
MMPEKNESIVYKTLVSFVEKWNNIFIRTNQDGKYENVSLDKIKDDKEVANFVIQALREKFEYFHMENGPI